MTAQHLPVPLLEKLLTAMVERRDGDLDSEVLAEIAIAFRNQLWNVCYR